MCHRNHYLLPSGLPLHLRDPITMTTWKICGRLVQKYMWVEPKHGSEALDRSLRSLKQCSGRPTSFTLSSSRGSSRSSESGIISNRDYWEEDAPKVVPSGCLAVYVGTEMRRFVIQASFLYTRVFRELLRRSEEEYGFETKGGLRIDCEAAIFEKLLSQLETSGSPDESF